MARKVYLSEELCDRIRDRLEMLSNLGPEAKAGGLGIAHRAADTLFKGCLTQERYQLKPMTPADYQRALNQPPHSKSEAKELDKLTPEQVREMQRLAIGDEYPARGDRRAVLGGQEGLPS
jgi:hypothetical protein